MIENIDRGLRAALGGRAVRRTLRRYLPTSTIVIPSAQMLAPSPLEIFDRDPSRMARYERLRDYYAGDMYTNDALQRRTKERQRTAGKDVSAQTLALYKFVRDFFNVVPQIVNNDVSAVFREPVRVQIKRQKGQTEDQISYLQEILDKVLRVSRFETERFQIVRHGAITGDTYLRVDYDPHCDYVKMFNHAPEIIRVKRNPFDKHVVDEAIISFDYEIEEDGKLKKYIRTDVITADIIRTFRDEEPFDFTDGQLGAEYENPLGIVPVTHIKNLDVDLEYGVPAFQDVLPVIDVVNEVMSFLFNIVKINADPTVVAYGIQPGGLKKGSAGDANQTTVWYVPAAREGMNARVDLIEWKGNLPDVMGLLNGVKEDIRDGLPELHLSKMRELGTVSGFALNAMLFPYVQKMSEMRTTYRFGTAGTLSMAVAYQAWREGKTDTFDPHDPLYDVEIGLPPVLPLDEDALLNRVIARLEAGLLDRTDALRELGTPDDEITDILARADADLKKRQATANTSAAAQRMSQQMQARLSQQGGQQGQGRMTPAQRAAAAVNGQPINNQLNSRSASTTPPVSKPL